MGRRGEQRMVPEAEFQSYYGKPILNGPVWKTPDIPAYLFLGGLAAGSSLLAAGADLTGRGSLATRSKVAALAAVAGSGVALVHDLGKPARFLNMLRTFKPTSPMSVGSWLLAAYSAPTGIAALSATTGRAPRVGAAATAGAAALAPSIAGYTAALLADTAVPAWRDARRELPFVFIGSASVAAGGLGLLTAADGEAGPARRLATLGWATEVAATELLQRRLGMVAEPYDEGTSGRYMKAGKVLGAVGVATAHLGRRRRAVRAVAGGTLLAASLATRYGVFHAGVASAADPKYTVVPQRERLAAT
jgi:DMSO reductase anchor subunit